MNWVKNMKLSVPSTIKQDSLLLTVLITKLIGMLFFKFLNQKQHNSEGEKRSMLQKGFWNKSENGYEFLVQSLSHVRLFVTPWTAAHQAPLSTISQSLLKFTSIELVILSNHLILCYSLLLLSSVFPNMRVFSNEYSGLISFRTDWFDFLAVQGSLKSLLQGYNSKASIFRHSAFFMVQLSHPYVTTGKTIALTTWIFVGKVMSLLFNTLSRFVIAFFPRSKHLLISWLLFTCEIIP